MEPGLTERHESDMAAATTPAGASDASGAVGGSSSDPSGAAAVGAVDGAASPSGPADSEVASSAADSRIGAVDGGAAASAGGGAASAGGGAASVGDSAPPRPRNRRGWMSDAPLDGGSGWPTSAYAIIRRPDDYLSANGSAATSPPAVEPAPQPIAAAPADLPPPTPKVKLPRQKSWLRARSWPSRGAAAGQSVTEATDNPQATAATVNLHATDATDNLHATDATVNPRATAATDNPQATGATVNPHATDATDNLHATAAAPEADAALPDHTARVAADVHAELDEADSTSHPVDRAEVTAITDANAPAAPGAEAGQASSRARPMMADTLDLEAAEETRDLREAMRSMRRPDDTASVRGTAVVTAGPQLGDAEESDGADPDPPTQVDEAATPRWLVIAAAVVIIVALALVVFFVIRANGNRTEETATTAPPSAVVEPDTSTAVSFAPEGSPAAAPQLSGALAGDVLRSGSVRLAIGPDQTDESFDFDSGIKGASNTFAGGQQSDLDALTQGLWAANGAHVAVWTKPGSPTAADCRGLPEGDWTSLVKLEPALVGPEVCVQTSEGRAASFVARPIDVGPDGRVQTVYLDFTVWKKAGD